MVSAVYIILLLMALVPQVVFSVLYWKWIPTWVKNPYGRLAQLDSWSQVLLLLVLLFILIFSSYLTIEEKRAFLAICLVPFILLSGMRLLLLKRAVDSSKEESKEEARSDN